MSPCQVLNLADVREIYGELPYDSNIFEESYDISPVDRTGLDSPFATSCDYAGVVVVEVEQHVTPRDFRRLGIGPAVTSLDTPEELQAKLRRYREATAETDDKTVRAFVDDVVVAGRAYRRFQQTSSLRAMRGLGFDDVVVPVGPDPFTFTIFHDNLAITLGPRPIDPPELPVTADVEVRDQLERAAAAVARVRERLADPDLSQSFAPTVIGETDALGETRLLEPCAVLTAAVFRTITGRRANDVVRRRVLPSDFEAPATSPSTISAANTCERTHEQTNADLSEEEVQVSLKVRYAPSVRALREGLRAEGYRPLPSGDVKLRTRADWAAELRVPGVGPLYTFAVGPYLVDVAVANVRLDPGVFGDIETVTADRATHLRAIDVLVTALRRHRDAVEADGG